MKKVEVKKLVLSCRWLGGMSKFKPRYLIPDLIIFLFTYIPKLENPITILYKCFITIT